MIKKEDQGIEYLEDQLKKAKLTESMIQKKKLLTRIEEKRRQKEQKKEQLQQCQGKINNCKYLCNYL